MFGGVVQSKGRAGHLFSLTQHFVAVKDSLALLLDLPLPALLSAFDPLQDRVSSRRAAAHLWLYVLRVSKHRRMH